MTTIRKEFRKCSGWPACGIGPTICRHSGYHFYFKGDPGYDGCESAPCVFTGKKAGCRPFKGVIKVKPKHITMAEYGKGKKRALWGVCIDCANRTAKNKKRNDYLIYLLDGGEILRVPTANIAYIVPADVTEDKVMRCRGLEG